MPLFRIWVKTSPFQEGFLPIFTILCSWKRKILAVYLTSSLLKNLPNSFTALRTQINHNTRSIIVLVVVAHDSISTPSKFKCLLVLSYHLIAYQYDFCWNVTTKTSWPFVQGFLNCRSVKFKLWRFSENDISQQLDNMTTSAIKNKTTKK